MVVGAAQKGGGVRDHNKAGAAGGRAWSGRCNVWRKSVRDSGRGARGECINYKCGARLSIWLEGEWERLGAGEKSRREWLG